MKNQKIGNKGQIAMEYLMTYGWALLIVMIAIAVMWQLEIFSLGSTTGPGYSGFGEVNLADFHYKSNGTFGCYLTNDAGGDIIINNITVKIYGDEYTSGTVDMNLSAGETKKCPTINTGPQDSPGDRYDLVLIIYFKDIETNVDHTSAGKVWGNYE